MLYQAKVPGSLMLLGEYAVVNGHPGIVCAVDRFITVTLTPASNNMLFLTTPLGQHHVSLDNIAGVAPFEYVLTACKLMGPFPQGFSLQTSGNLSPRLGLGSSAAVTVGTLSVLYQWKHGHLPPPHTLWELSKKVIETVQGQGSGADAAASIWGGVCLFQNAPLQVSLLENTPPLTVVYSGQKQITTQALASISQLRTEFPHFMTAWDNSMSRLTETGYGAIQKKDWETLGRVCHLSHGLLRTLGVSPSRLEKIVTKLEQQNEIRGAKISGSGFGDCIIAIGSLTKNLFPLEKAEKPHEVQTLNINIAALGVSSTHATH